MHDQQEVECSNFIAELPSKKGTKQYYLINGFIIKNTEINIYIYIYSMGESSGAQGRHLFILMFKMFFFFKKKNV